MRLIEQANLRLSSRADEGELDAALAEHDPVNQQLGVADQRIENWFKPFAGTVPTGYISVD